MITRDFQKWITIQSKKLSKKFGGTKTVRESIYARTVKLNEEVGELCAEILAYDNNQRAEKMSKYSDESLCNEFADVIITTLLVAEKMDVDINKALKRKIKKIDERFKDV